MYENPCYSEDDCGDRRRRMLGNPGGCDGVTINCPVNAQCTINCSFDCRDLTVYAQDSSMLSITNCDNCDGMGIHCPRNGIDQQCQLQISADISDLNVYAEESFHDFKLYQNNQRF